MNFNSIAKWIRSLRGEEAEKAARLAVKPVGMSRRGFLRAIGLGATTICLGNSLTLATLDDGDDFVVETEWSHIINSTIQDYIDNEEVIMLRVRLIRMMLHKQHMVYPHWKVKS